MNLAHRHLGIVLLTGMLPAWAVPDAGGVFQPFITNVFSYDSNVYRLPVDLPPSFKTSDLIGTRGSKADFIDRISVGGRVRMPFGRQRLDLDLDVDDNLFLRNPNLDNVSTANRAVWNWDGSSGGGIRVGAEYQRYLAQFGNYEIPIKDMLANVSYFGEIRQRMISNWYLRGAVDWAGLTHSAEIRKRNDVEELGQTGEIVYESPRGNRIGFQYRHSGGSYPNRVLSPTQVTQDKVLSEFNRYNQDAFKLLFQYDLSVKTRFDGYVGYLIQDFPRAEFRNFSGEIWRMNVAWEPSYKTRLAVSGWRNLDFYQEIASSYYIGEGVKLSPSWTPTEKIAVTAAITWENRDYVGAGVPGVVSPLPRRHDDFFAGEVGVSYWPTRSCGMFLVYRHETRKVNRIFFGYEYDGMSFGIQLRL
ncbi:MAG TPA: outer membrane beta-barrel protein [Methylococcus sp.]|nr:outer membrane beta-barrel protein [Methylococcus sp.]